MCVLGGVPLYVSLSDVHTCTVCVCMDGYLCIGGGCFLFVSLSV